jgi:hypothetical protein
VLLTFVGLGGSASASERSDAKGLRGVMAGKEGVSLSSAMIPSAEPCWMSVVAAVVAIETRCSSW